MKWLIFFPVWVILASYALYRVKVAGRDAAPEAMAVEQMDAGAVVGAGSRERQEPSKPRPPRVSREAILGEAVAFGERAQLILPDRQPDNVGVSPLWPPVPDASKALQLAMRKEFDRWGLFESDELSFYYPDESGFRVERLEGGEPPPMIGGLFHRADVLAEKWYRVIGPNDVTWGAVAIDRSADFDSSERYPTPYAFHKLLLAGDGVARVSCGEDGRVRRVQWLGQGLRVTMLDWQHCAAHRDAYLALAASLRLSSRVRGRRAVLGDFAVGAGLEPRLGLLERGMREMDVEAILGRPTGVAENTWVYHVPDREGDRYYRVEFESGLFPGLRENWRTVRKDPPIKGSLEWMLEKTGIRAGLAGGIGYNLGSLTDEDAELIFREMRARLPVASESQWSELCQILANMAELRLKDEAVLEQLERRFLEPTLSPLPAAMVLRSWAPEAAKQLFAQKSGDILGDPRWTSEEVALDGGQRIEDLRILIPLIGKRHPETHALVAAAVKHPHEAVRSLGASLSHELSDGERQRVWFGGLADSSPQVRRWCAEAFALDGARPADRELLEAKIGAEADEETRKHLARALEGLGSTPLSGS